MGIVAGNLATMRPLLQRIVANTTRLTNSLRGHSASNQPSKNRADSPPNNVAPSVTLPARAHVDHRRGALRDDYFAFFRHGDAKDVEYGVHVWHGDNNEELGDVSSDVELVGSIFQTSELIVREETTGGFPAPPKE